MKFRKNGWMEELGNIYHYIDGIIHNDNGPALILSCGIMAWYKNDLHHREDGPSIINEAMGIMCWHYEGKLIGHSTEGYTQEKFEQWKKLKAFI